MKFVVDTSALLALIKGEPGGGKVHEYFKLPGNSFFMHTLNVTEVFYHLLNLGIPEDASWSFSLRSDVVQVSDSGIPLCRRAAIIKTTLRSLSIVDCMTIALAERLDAGILAADRDFAKVKTTAKVILIR